MVLLNLDKQPTRCQHNSNKFWTPIKTLRVIRNGYGDAIKTVVERCNKCGEQREHKLSFTDTRISYEPYVKSGGDIFKNAAMKDHRPEIKTYNKIFK